MADDEPYEGLKLDMLDLVEVRDPRLLGVLTDFQAGQLVRQQVHGLRADAEKFRHALAEDVKRATGCEVCFYTGFERTFSAFGTQLDPAHPCSYCGEERDA